MSIIQQYRVYGHLHEDSNLRQLDMHLTETFLQLVTPNEATYEVLLDVHTPEYLQQLKTSKITIAQVLSHCQTMFSATV